MLCLLSGPPGFNCLISFATVFSCMFCWVLIFVLSPFVILIICTWRRVRDKFMRIKHICVLIHIRIKGEVGTVKLLSPPVILLLTIPRWYKCICFVDFFYAYVFAILSCQCHAALWSPARKGLPSWLSWFNVFSVLLTFPYGIQGQVW